MLNLSESQDSYFRFAGVRFWPSSIVPAMVGTTLPFWLRPPGFAFKWFSAVEFFAAAVLLHAGFSFLLSFFEKKRTEDPPRTPLLILTGLCLFASFILGWHLSSVLTLHKGVYPHIFIIYGLAALFVGLLYVVPPRLH
jgi:1,4-dihydroxy-2-naphthoate octaprenyltransferase